MVEGILKDQRSIHMTVKGSLGSFSQKKNTTKTTKQKGKRMKKKSKGWGKCFFCGKKGHWKNECFKFLKRQSGMHHSFLVESCLVLDSTNYWWIDFEATDHVCNSFQGFNLKRRLNYRDMCVTLTSKERIVVQAVRDVTPMLDDSCLLELKDSLYVLKYKKILILVSTSCEQNYSLLLFFIINKFLLN